MRYGYYLAALDEEHGDPELSGLMRARWLSLEHPDPGRFDGASMWMRDGEQPEIRILANDFFFIPKPGKPFHVAQAMVTTC